MRLSTGRLFIAAILFFVLAGSIFAQVPTGGIRGAVSDPSRAVMPNVTVTVRNKATGAERQIATNSDGQFQITNLPPGEYEVKAAARGFKTALSAVTVQVGENVTVDFELEIGAASETVVISGDASSIINTTDYKIDGVVSRQQIENLPLNGRNFLQLSSLEPAVEVESVTSTGALPNNFFRVSIAGAGSHLTRLSVDGATINDKVTGGTAQNFSQESVQEFQISTFNFDLTTSVTGVGSVNVVSRTGGNQLHGSAFLYYRDHNLSAYPDLGRDPRRFTDPSRDDPFFARRQSGGSLSGRRLHRIRPHASPDLQRNHGVAQIWRRFWPDAGTVQYVESRADHAVHQQAASQYGDFSPGPGRRRHRAIFAARDLLEQSGARHHAGRIAEHRLQIQPDLSDVDFWQADSTRANDQCHRSAGRFRQRRQLLHARPAPFA
ncbi:MAG: carboxypeptidase regulatory-like domain-containing protein [Blastocatellia bacterium]